MSSIVIALGLFALVASAEDTLETLNAEIESVTREYDLAKSELLLDKQEVWSMVKRSHLTQNLLPVSAPPRAAYVNSPHFLEKCLALLPASRYARTGDENSI